MLSRLVLLRMISYPMSKPLAFLKWSRLIMSAYARQLAWSSGPQLGKRPWSVIVASLWLFYQKDKSLQFYIFGLNWPFICNKPQVPQFGTSIDWFIGNKKFLSFYFYLYSICLCFTVNFPQHKTSVVLIEWMWRARRLASEEYNVSLLSFVVGRRDTYSNHQSVEQKMQPLCGNSTEDMELFQNTSVQCFVR